MAKGRPYSANKFIQAVLKEVIKKGSVQVRAGYLKKFATDIDVIIGKQAARVFPLIVSLMGGKSTGNPYVLSIKNLSAGEVLAAQQLRPGNSKTRFQNVTWLPLSQGTISRKRELAKKGKIDASHTDRFFLQTGALRDYFKTADYRSTLGNTRVNFFQKVASNPASKKTDFIKILGVLRFSIFKNIAPYLQAILEGKFDPDAKMEKKAFGSEVGTKLAGFAHNKAHHRALVQPVLNYIIGRAIPNAIAKDIIRREKISGERTNK